MKVLLMVLRFPMISNFGYAVTPVSALTKLFTVTGTNKKLSNVEKG